MLPGVACPEHHQLLSGIGSFFLSGLHVLFLLLLEILVLIIIFKLIAVFFTQCCKTVMKNRVMIARRLEMADQSYILGQISFSVKDYA